MPLHRTLSAITPQCADTRRIAHERLSRLTMPHWALGRLMDLAEDLAGMTRALSPPFARKLVVTCAGDHGVVIEGVSAYPQEVTPQMVANFLSGGAAINAIAKSVGADHCVVNLGVAADLSGFAANDRFIDRPVRPGTHNMALGPAMSREEAVKAIETGMAVVEGRAAQFDLFATGDMGIGNTTPSAAIASVVTGRSPGEVTGRGTGIQPGDLGRKTAVVESAVAVNVPDPNDGLDVLAKVGGFEIGGIAGVILGAAAHRKPVVIDGFISGAGALVAGLLAPESMDYVIAGHVSEEPGHAHILAHLGKCPLLDLGMRLGEGTGATLAFPLVEAAARLLTDVRTFEEAAVSDRASGGAA